MPPFLKTAHAVAVAWFVLIAVVFLGIWFGFAQGQADKSPAPSAGEVAEFFPPAVVVVNGACPFEGCQLGKWIAKVSIPVYDAPGGALKRNLSPGETVNATASEVRAEPRKAVVTRTYNSDEEQGLHVGNLVYVLHPIGEGAVALWDKGRVIHGSLDLTFRFEETSAPPRLKWDWWVQVLLKDGVAGWVRNPQGQLKGMDRLG